jgi:hypothetical protein
MNIETCSVCHDLWPRTKSITLNSVHFRRSIGELRESAALRGCPSCELVVQAASKFESACNRKVANIQMHLAHPDEPSDWLRGGERNLSLQFQFDNDAWSDHYEFLCLPGTISPWKSIPTRSMISYHLGSEGMLSWAVGRIKECRDSHDNCPGQQPNPLPTRILKINACKGSLGTEQTLEVKLCKTNNEAGIYACLSHCWGGAQFIKTTRDNMEKHESGIPWSSLPKTFQHAIEFAYQLDIQYIWIDSLCIIQDDEEDWRREAGNMCSVFEGSFVTLAASASSNSLARALPEDDRICDASELLSIVPPKIDPQIVPLGVQTSYDCGFRGTNWTCDMVYMRRTQEHWRFLWWPYNTFGYLGKSMSEQFPILRRSWEYREKIRRSGSDLFPLFQRGWAYQERLLAPRILHFGLGELLWECSQISECQCGALTSIYDHRTSLDVHPKRNHYLHSKTSDRHIAVYRWREVVREYSPLKLTFPSDKLPAIAGIAKQLHPFIGSTYLAGIWKEYIRDELLWETVGPKQAKPTAWRAPTWSWASVEGTISFPNGYIHSSDTDYSILEAVCTPIGPDQFGAISDGHLTVHGKVVSVRLFQLSTLPSTPDAVPAEPAIALKEGLKEPINVSFDSCWLDADDSQSKGPQNWTKSYDILFCFLLGMNRRVTGDESPPPLGLVYLVLECVDQSKQLYERVGIGSGHDYYDLFSDVEKSIITIK